MKKGFTLIELLATIVIIGVVATIATTTVLKTIESARYSAINSNADIFLEAAEKYVAFNSSLSSLNIGDKIEISIDDIISSGYLKPIKSPLNSNECGGYVIVEKVSVGNYDYKPHFDCVNEISNSTNDKLLAHYDFNDFQEPTTNLFQNLNLNTHMQGGITYTYVGMEDGWMKYAISGTATADTYPYTFSINPYTINSNFNTSFSFKYKTNVEHKYVSFGDFYMVNINYKPGITKSSIKVDDYYLGKYESVSPLSTTGGVPIVGDSSQSIYFSSRPISGTVFNPSTDFLYFKEVQIETKDYATEYVNGTRNGTVSDKSINNKDITMDLAKTPKWMLDSNRGGVYNFDSDTEVLSAQNTLTGVYASQQFSWGAFVKLNSNFSVTGRILMSQFNVLEITANWNRTISAAVKDANGYNNFTSTAQLSVDKWYHVFLTCDGSVAKMYINGVLENQKTVSGFINPSDHIYIGNWESAQDINGQIDDVMVYGRTLNDQEVRSLYEQLK